jgi:hypothetical protein
MKKLSVGILSLVLIGFAIWNAQSNEVKNSFTGKTLNFKSSIAAKTFNFEAIKEVISAKDSQSEVIEAAKQTLLLKEDALDSQSLSDRIVEIDRFLDNGNAVNRMNSGDLDEETRNEFIAIFELRQELLNKLVDREVKASQEYLAGQK